MSIYLGLVFAVLMVPVFVKLCRPSIDTRTSNTVLAISLFFVFVVMALKAPSVGRDIPGYKRMYESMAFASWDNFDLYWTEPGYEFLEMVFSKVLHVPFQVFMIVIYAFVYISYGLFIKKHSMDYTFSILIYICFTFLVFDTSAIRTLMGVAICLYAYSFAEGKGIRNTIISFLLTLLAAQIHRSAYVFIAVYFIVKLRFNRKTAILYIGIPIALMAAKGQIYGFIAMNLKNVQEGNASFGGNLLFYTLCFLFTFFIWMLYKRKGSGVRNIMMEEKADISVNTSEALSEQHIGLKSYFVNSALAMRLIYAGIVLQLFASETVLARLAQYLQIFIIVLLPNSVARLNRKSRFIVKAIIYVFLVWYFWRYALVANALDIVPYKFYWQS